MAAISSVIWDAGLSTISAKCTHVRILGQRGTVMVNATINSSNFGAKADSTGRKLKCLKGSTNTPLTNVSVSIGGTAVSVQLLKNTTQFVLADITGSTLTLSTLDKVNFSTFGVRFRALTS